MKYVDKFGNHYTVTDVYDYHCVIVLDELKNEIGVEELYIDFLYAIKDCQCTVLKSIIDNRVNRGLLTPVIKKLFEII